VDRAPSKLTKVGKIVVEVKNDVFKMKICYQLILVK